MQCTSTAHLLAVAGHVRPGTSSDPAAAAALLDRGDGVPVAVTVVNLAALTVPPRCLVLGCDGSGAAVGAEWTGVLTGLAWAGATERQVAAIEQSAEQAQRHSDAVHDAVTAATDEARELLDTGDGP